MVIQSLITNYYFYKWGSMRVLLAEGQTRVRRALHFFLKEQPGLIIVGETSEMKSLLRQVNVTYPDVVLLDWDLPGCAPTEVLQVLRQANHRLRVIALSSDTEVRYTALAAGANGFICKYDPPQVLLAALQRAI